MLGPGASQAFAGEQTPPDWNGITLGSPHRGGTLHLTADGPGGTLDPQINYGTQYMQVFVNMYDPLLTFRLAREQRGWRSCRTLPMPCRRSVRMV